MDTTDYQQSNLVTVLEVRMRDPELDNGPWYIKHWYGGDEKDLTRSKDEAMWFLPEDSDDITDYAARWKFHNDPFDEAKVTRKPYIVTFN